jgi:phage shock protein A
MPDNPSAEDPPPRVTPLPPVTPAVEPNIDPGYDESGVPTFESVREKIENRYTTSLGAAELDADTPEGRRVEEQYEKRQRAAAERLAQIRESMRQQPEDPHS